MRFANFSLKNLEVKITSLIFAVRFAQNSERFFLATFANVLEREIGSLNYWYCLRKTKHFLQWRVWSWLRINASGRPNTCKSRGSGWSASVLLPATGGRVRNAYATCLQQGDNPKKFGLIPHNIPTGICRSWKLRWLEMGMRCISWLVR